MNWRPVTELPELDDDGYGPMVLLWISDGSVQVGYYANGKKSAVKGWFVGHGEYLLFPRFWCEIVPPEPSMPTSSAVDAKIE